MARAERHLTLTYRGDAVEDGLMRVEDLAPALLGFSRAIRRAQHLSTGGNGPAPEVHARALRQGSFAVDLVLVEGSLIKDVVDLLSGDEGSAMVNLATFVGIAFGGFKVIKGRFGKTEVGRTTEHAQLTIAFDDGTTLTVPEASARLADDAEFTIAAREVVSPLDSEGVVEVELSDASEVVNVTRDERSAFTPVREIDGGEESIVDMSLSLSTVSFTEGNKWRVSDGASSFFVEIADQKFAERVTAGVEAFAKGDVIRARVRILQWRDPGGKLRIERTVLHVLEHRKVQSDEPMTYGD